ncbi:MAG: hypothetical protein N2Z58_07690 [Fervidobacterium sp.]|nr:hypothetical protein [Fervidobacterium sp.]
MFRYVVFVVFLIGGFGLWLFLLWGVDSTRAFLGEQNFLKG